MKLLNLTLFTIFLCFFLQLNAQLPGIIVRPPGTAGPAVLDPNGNGYTSLTTAGFGSNDITNSEIAYKVIAPLIPEPTGDLLRGPSGAFSDIVQTVDGSGFYLFSDGTNLLSRLRIGGIVSGSKGYSILLDTDQKFGPSGPYADPNFLGATTGNNGNPGFEFEIVLETNFRIAVYNVDGTSTPVLVASYSINSNSQVSVASTTDGGNPDYFYDFYVPYGVMGLTSSTPIRATATTVMCPCPAIGGPKSDIYGSSGNNYMNDWIDVILLQPVFTFDDLTGGGGGTGPKCTAPPVVNEPIDPSATSITGSWTKSVYSLLTSATITLYKGGSSIGTTTVSSGGSWSITVSGLANNDVITAKAVAVGESQCLTSNEVTVNNCSNATHTTIPAVTCSSLRGFEGTRESGAAIRLYKLTSSGYALYANDATTPYLVTYPTATTWRYDDLNTQSGSACTGGPADITAGAYVILAELAPNCASLPLNVCIPGSAAPATPVVTSLLIDGASVINGTAAANSGVNLWIDGYFVQSVTATAGGIFSFTLLKKLQLNQQVQINSATTGSCASTAFNATVSCYIAAPVINANSLNQVSIGSQLTGTSSAITGSTITVYNAVTSVIIGTTTVQANGSWTLASPVVASGITYNASITGSACGNSAASNIVTSVTATSNARCGTITGPVTESVTSVAGTVTTAVANTTVTLYVDGISAGSVVIAGTAWSIPVNTTVNNTVYAGAVLTIGITEASKTEVTCAASVIVSCNIPTTPAISPIITTIVAGQTVTYTITSTQSGILYSVRDDADAANLGGSTFGTGADLMLITDPFNIAGTYTVRLKATSFSGPGCEASSTATVFVTALVPLTITDFTGKYVNGISKLNWVTTYEQDLKVFEIEKSYNGHDFKTIGRVQAIGNSQVLQHYMYDDPEANSQLVYYRLKIIENKNLNYSYSKVLVLRPDKGIVMNQLGPNPFSENIQISIDVSKNSSLVINLKDMTGRNIKTLRYPAKKGLNLFSIDGLDNLATGNYIIELFSDGERFSSQLLMKK